MVPTTAAGGKQVLARLPETRGDERGASRASHGSAAGIVVCANPSRGQADAASLRGELASTQLFSGKPALAACRQACSVASLALKPTRTAPVVASMARRTRRRARMAPRRLSPAVTTVR